MRSRGRSSIADPQVDERRAERFGGGLGVGPQDRAGDHDRRRRDVPRARSRGTHACSRGTARRRTGCGSSSSCRARSRSRRRRAWRSARPTAISPRAEPAYPRLTTSSSYVAPGDGRPRARPAPTRSSPRRSSRRTRATADRAARARRRRRSPPIGEHDRPHPFGEVRRPRARRGPRRRVSSRTAPSPRAAGCSSTGLSPRARPRTWCPRPRRGSRSRRCAVV